MGRIKSVGVIGGTFDPPHYGHLILAQSACNQLGLEMVLWVVAADPPHKQHVKLTDVDTRLAMVRAAIRGNRKFKLSRLDVDRTGPHYTVDMLEMASEKHPGKQLYFLVGSDSLRNLSRWHQPHRLFDHAKLAVLTRTTVDVELTGVENYIPNMRSNIVSIVGPVVDISSTTIRNMICQNQSIRYLVPPSVEAVISRQGLYTTNG